MEEDRGVCLPLGKKAINVEKEEDEAQIDKENRNHNNSSFSDVVICDHSPQSITREPPSTPKICQYCQTAARFLSFRTLTSK
jgi:hypothetical protein